MAERPEAMPLESELPPLTREECLALLSAIVHDQGISLEDRLDALRVHAQISGWRLSEVDRWRVFSALLNGTNEVGADRVMEEKAASLANS